MANLGKRKQRKFKLIKRIEKSGVGNFGASAQNRTSMFKSEQLASLR